MNPAAFLSTLEPISGIPPRIITLTVGQGDNVKVFCVSSNVLCYHSAFFRAALNGEFQEAHTNAIALPEDDPILMGHILLWMHGNDYTFKRNNTTRKMMDFIILADKLLLDPSPAQHIADHHVTAIMKGEVGRKAEKLTAETIALVYSNPAARPMAVALAKYTVEKYIKSRWSSSSPFEFKEELRLVKGYAEDLLELVTEALLNGSLASDCDTYLECPITQDIKSVSTRNTR